METTEAVLQNRNIEVKHEDEIAPSSPSSSQLTASHSPQMPANPGPNTKTCDQGESSTGEATVTEVDQLLSQNIVTCRVGPKRRTFQIHHDLISSASGHFKTVLRSGVTGKPITEQHLLNRDAEAFSLFVTYLYRGGVKAQDSSGVVEGTVVYLPQA
ncbi:MAG: hypothetical protein LQ350_005273 [Teloschistes chrysophthalmus]|nr:MAG: hypothetical protein LQ350_005273 [Niorma chrysophthalma]